MKYDIVVHPKHWPVTAAKTGDNSNCELYMSGLAVIVFIPLIKKAKTEVKMKIEKWVFKP